MNLFENPNTIKQLRNLLRDPDYSSSDSDIDIDDEPVAKAKIDFSPGSIGPKPKTKSSKKRAADKLKKPEVKLEAKPEETDAKIKKDPEDPYKQVDEWLEKQEREDGIVLENRKRPDYTVSYKQAVGTEDVYLQMGNKTAATTSCEDMVIVVKLPEETVSIEAMNLAVTEDDIDLQTPVYRLRLPLAHKIDPDKGRAKYDSENKVLTLTLRMNREFDFVNF